MSRSADALAFAKQSNHELSELFTLLFEPFDFQGRSGDHFPLPLDLAGSASSIAIAAALSNVEPSVATDQDDYAPGATATITASGFGDGATVTFEVDHVDGAGDDGVYGTGDDEVVELGGAGHEPWTVTDGGVGDLDGLANGTIVTTWFVNPDDSLDERFLLTASDGIHTATSSFTDGHETLHVGDIPPAGALTLLNFNEWGTFDTASSDTDVVFAQGHQEDPTGTGNILPFLRVQDDTSNNDPGDLEEGFNSDFRAPGNPKVEFDEDTNSNWNHALAISDVPILNGIDLDFDGTIDITGAFYQFRLDLNEPNSTQDPDVNFISLDELQVYLGNSPQLHDFIIDTGFVGDGADPADDGDLDSSGPIFDLDEHGDSWIEIRDIESGSGRADMFFYLPVDAVDSENFEYFYFYTAFGDQFDANATFEEWNVAKVAKLSGIKYHDLNTDGDQDAGESGLGGWTILAFADDGDGVLELAEFNAGPVNTAVTDASGAWEIGSLSAGSYILVEENQANWDESPDDDTTEVNPSGFDDLSNFGYAVTVDFGDELGGFDFANFQLAQISGFKFEDLDGDGAAGSNPPIVDWTISLYKDDNHDNVADPGELVASTDTDASGFYQFTGLMPGDYLLVEETPSGWTNTTPIQINLNTVNSGDNLQNNNFLNFELFDISGTKFEDTNGDGSTAGDSGLAGWTIFIDLDDSGTLTAGDETTTTAADGSWSFTDLDYTYDGKTVYEVNQNGWVQTLGAAGYDIVGTSGNDQTGLDFANFELFDISGHKWNDLNGNSMWDAGEPGLENWTIFIDLDGNTTFDWTDAGAMNGVWDSGEGDRWTTTAADGSWSFTDLDWTYAGKTVYEVQQMGWTNSFDGSATIIGTSGTDQSGDFEETEDFNFGNFVPSEPGTAMTPGFWRNHLDRFDKELADGGVNADQNSDYEDVFGVDLENDGSKFYPNDPSLAQALVAKGGGEGALLRASTAGLANAASDDLNYSFAQNGDLDDGIEFGIIQAFGLEEPDPADYFLGEIDPAYLADLADFNTAFQDALNFVIPILEDIDLDDDLVLSPDEVINAVQDVYTDGLADSPDDDSPGDGLPTTDDFDFGDIDDVATAFDVMNNMPHIDASEFDTV